MRKIYTAVDAEYAADELTAFAEKWDHRYPMMPASRALGADHPVLAHPADVRRVIYTTNSIEVYTARRGRSSKPAGTSLTL